MIRRRPALAATALLIMSTAASGAVVAQDEPLKVFGAYATEIDGALGRGHPHRPPGGGGRRPHRVQATPTPSGYSGDMELTLREVAEIDQPDIIFGDAFGNEEAVRSVAADYPDIAFVFGSGVGPAGDELQRLRQLDP